MYVFTHLFIYKMQTITNSNIGLKTTSPNWKKNIFVTKST